MTGVLCTVYGAQVYLSIYLGEGKGVHKCMYMYGNTQSAFST